MRIVCPSCGAHVSAGDADLATGLARCHACQHVFRFDTAPPLAAAEPAAGAPAERQPHAVGGPARRLPLAAEPTGVAVQSLADRLVIQQRWFTPQGMLGMLLFTAFWNGVVFHQVRDAIRDGPDLTFLVTFESVFVGAGLFLSYLTLAILLNRTTVTVGDSWLRVRTRPLPLGRSVDLPSAGIRQLYCEEKTTRHNRGKSTRYELAALMRDGTRRRVLSDSSPELLLYVERHAEAWLKLPDEAVAGELARY